jgi:phytoene dehydrogenase-like protein
VIIGGGHNGLVTAGLLARAGLKPLVLERRETVGGASVTEEFHPGFKVSTLAHTAGPMRASVLRDLGITLDTEEPEPRVVAPVPDGPALCLFGDPQKTAAEIRRFSSRDSERYLEFHRCLGRVSRLLSRVLEMTPPDVSPAPRDLWPLLRLAVGFRGLGREDAQRLLRWAAMPIADFAGEWFENERLQALVAARGISGMFAGPWSAGTTANMLLRAAASGGNGAGSTVHVKGGLGALTGALANAARGFGAEIRTGAEVAAILTREGRARGVVLAGGEEIAARAVASSADPRRTFLGLLDAALLDPEELRRVRGIRQPGMASKVNLALSGCPSFAGVEAQEPITPLRGRIHVSRDIASIERAFDEAKYGGVSSRPYLDVTLPSLCDPGLAPPGCHVLSAYVQYTPYRLASGDWAARGAEVGDTVLRTLEEYAPGISRLVVHSQVLTPFDLERTYGLTGGHPDHGEASLNQIFAARPLLGWARYRCPIEGLYLCGAGAHPGGGVTGGPGANAAREILADMKSFLA